MFSFHILEETTVRVFMWHFWQFFLLFARRKNALHFSNVSCVLLWHSYFTIFTFLHDLTSILSIDFSVQKQMIVKCLSIKYELNRWKKKLWKENLVCPFCKIYTKIIKEKQIPTRKEFLDKEQNPLRANEGSLPLCVGDPGTDPCN